MKVQRVVIPLCLAAGVAVAQSPEGHQHRQAAGAEVPGTATARAGLERMQKRMRELQATMDRIQASDDDVQRKRWMSMHMIQMHQLLDEMRGAAAPGTSTPDDARPGRDPMAGTPVPDRLRLLETRMDVVEGMMDQMMDQFMEQMMEHAIQHQNDD